MLYRAVAIQESRRGDGPDSRNARISIGRVADEGKEVGDQHGFHAELPANAFRVENLLRSAVHLYHALAAHALGEILVDRPDADFLYALIVGCDPCSRGKRIVGFELDHRPYDDPHGGERLLQWVELREQ